MIVFFFKQKTAYEMRISDWSSDVCSSDLTYTEKKDTRSGFGVGLLEAGRSNPNVVGLCADLIGSLKMGDFKKEFPERFFQVGIAEANMMGLADRKSVV